MTHTIGGEPYTKQSMAAATVGANNASSFATSFATHWADMATNKEVHEVPVITMFWLLYESQSVIT